MELLRSTGNISEQDHAILRLSPLAQRELMDLTLGDEGALTGTGLREILSRVKESLVSEQKIVAAADRAIMEAQLANAHLSIEEREKAYKEAISRQQELGRRSDEATERLREDQRSLVLTASRRAKLFSRVFTISSMAVFSALLLVGAFAGAGLISATDPVYNKLLLVVVGVAVVWGWYSWLTGKTVRAVTQQVEYAFTLRIFTWLTGKPTLPD